jgi:hypothetical protein
MTHDVWTEQLSPPGHLDSTRQNTHVSVVINGHLDWLPLSQQTCVTFYTSFNPLKTKIKIYYI